MVGLCEWLVLEKKRILLLAKRLYPFVPPQIIDMKSFICYGTFNVIQIKMLILGCMKVNIYSVRDPLRGTVIL